MATSVPSLDSHLSAGAKFVHEEPFTFIAYSVGLIVVYALVLMPAYRWLAGMSTVSRFDNPYVQYTGPGLALDRTMGSCRSDTADEHCGAAEPFRAQKKLSGFDSEYGHLPAHKPARSGFVDTQNLRYLATTSRFLNGREPDAVMYMDNDEMGELQKEVYSMADDSQPAAAPASGDASQAAQATAAQATAAAVQAAQSGQVTAAQAPAAAAAAAAPAGPDASQAAAQATAAAVAGQISAAQAPAAAAQATASRFAARRGGEHLYAAALHGH